MMFSDKDVLTSGLQSVAIDGLQASSEVIALLVLDLYLLMKIGSMIIRVIALEYTKAVDIRLLTGNGKIDRRRWRMQLFRTLQSPSGDFM